MDRDWTAPIDAYCERTDASFWSEPLNAVTNLAFLAAALYGLVLSRRSGDRGVLALAVVTLALAIGSFLFHTLATAWAAVADTTPIMVFVALATILTMRRMVGLGWIATLVLTGVFLAVSPLVSGLVRVVFGSSAQYASTLFALLLVGGWGAITGRPGGRVLLGAGLAFVVSLGLRMADLPLCAVNPYGTHLGWHVLNGLVLALVMRAVRDAGAARA